MISAKSAMVLPAGKTILGRTDGHLNFPNDSRLSRRHARFFASDKAQRAARGWAAPASCGPL